KAPLFSSTVKIARSIFFRSGTKVLVCKFNILPIACVGSVLMYCSNSVEIGCKISNIIKQLFFRSFFSCCCLLCCCLLCCCLLCCCFFCRCFFCRRFFFDYFLNFI